MGKRKKHIVKLHADISNPVVASFIGVIFMIVYEINGTKNDVIMNMPFINVGG